MRVSKSRYPGCVSQVVELLQGKWTIEILCATCEHPVRLSGQAKARLLARYRHADGEVLQLLGKFIPFPDGDKIPLGRARFVRLISLNCGAPRSPL